jgi:hypothetical protein
MQIGIVFPIYFNSQKQTIMKNTITNFALVLIAFVAINLIMSFARPVAAPDEPKQYIVIKAASPAFTTSTEKFEQTVNQKLAEGWHLQGGVSWDGGNRMQAMVK